MLLHYHGKLKFAANPEEKCKRNALIFTCIHFNASRLLTYYFSFWFLLNIFGTADGTFLCEHAYQ